MKKLTILLSAIMLLTISAFGKAQIFFPLDNTIKDPIVIEIITKFTSIDDALIAAKNTLLMQKFIATNGIQKPAFSSTRTTGSKADYYVADVSAIEVNGKIKLTISFVKVGTGFLNLQKVADAVKSELEK